jgi:catalase-peroxidase
MSPTIVLTGNCALDSMGLKTFGFGGLKIFGNLRKIFIGALKKWLDDNRYTGA